MTKISHNNQKKIAVINDMSGFGRCSLTVSIPIISHLKVQACPLPTSIFSNHTGFESYYFDDYTDRMGAYMAEWKKLGLKFDGIYSGFLGSLKQIDIVEKFIKEFRSKRTKVIIDPVMGDYGKKYATYTDEMCAAMKRLVSYADVLTPNLTEACVLTDTPYKPKGWKIRELEELAEKLLKMGCKKVVITGIPQGQFVTNLSYMKYDEKEWEGKKCTAKIEGGFAKRINKTHLIGCERSGTGDVFASIVAADTVNGVDLITSARRASHFVKKCLTVSEKIGIPVTDGVCFEEIIDSLKVIR